MASSKRYKGKITSWNDEKGFGFIANNTNDKQVFIHIKAIKNLNRNIRPEIGQKISYELSTDKQGRPCADKSMLSGGRFLKIPKLISRSIPVMSIASFFAVVGLAVSMKKIPPFILALYILFSIITFIIYALDKSAARKGNWRTKETSLHLLSLAGGWPGALLAQKMIRHKTIKQPFLTIFWITSVINAAVFVWLLTPSGAEALQKIISSIVWILTADMG